MEEAVWYVIGDSVWAIAGGMFALAFVTSVLLLAVGGVYHPRFHILGGNGVFSRRAKYGESDEL